MTNWSLPLPQLPSALERPAKGSSAAQNDPPGDAERIGHFLLGLADLFELLAKRLREFAAKLFAMENRSQDQWGGAAVTDDHLPKSCQAG